MKVIATKESLSYGVQVVQKAVSGKSPLPILSGILLQAKDNLLKITGTDLDIGIECNIPVTVAEEGSVVVPAKYFNEIVKKLPDTKIEIDLKKENNQIIIKYGQSEININGLPAEDYPMLPVIDKDYSITLKGNLFKSMIKQTVFASSFDNARPVFTGCLMDIKEDELNLVATDTHRLAYRRVKIDNQGSLANHSIIIPAKTLVEVNRLINEETEVTVSITENQILFEMDEISLISRLIEGQFPNYRQVIPTEFKSKVRIKTKDLLESAERASLMAREGSSVIKISVEDYNMTISSNSPEIGKIQENLPVFLDGDGTQISFNSKYFTDVLKVIESEEVNLELTGSLSPGIVKPVENNNFIYLILPVRTI